MAVAVVLVASLCDMRVDENMALRDRAMMVSDFGDRGSSSSLCEGGTEPCF